MTTKQWLFITVPMVIIIIGLLVLVFVPSKGTEPAQNLSSGSDEPGKGSTSASSTNSGTSSSTGSVAELDNLIEVKAPLKNAVISSPLTVTGQARGAWYFEASAPVKLLDANKHIIAQGHITAQGDWMTEDFVPFTATLTFTKPTTSTGTLVLENDNPSGDPSRQQELDIPVRF